MANENVVPFEVNHPTHQAEPAGLLIEPIEIIDRTVPYALDPGAPMRDLDLTTPVPAAGNRREYETGMKRWGTDNAEAIHVFERASSDFTAESIYVSSNSYGFQLVGRVKGRKSVTIWVPTSYTNAVGTVVSSTGVVIAEVQGKAEQGNGIQLNPGDSISISTEAPIYVGLLPGQTVGNCQYVVEYNPANSLGF